MLLKMSFFVTTHWEEVRKSRDITQKLMSQQGFLVIAAFFNFKKIAKRFQFYHFKNTSGFIIWRC